jgi:hypothetical protein
MRQILVTHLFLFFVVFTVAQQRPVPKLVNHLLSSSGRQVNAIEGHFTGFIPERMLPAKIRGESQYLVRSDSGLFVGIAGTGWLFRIFNLGDSLHFDRVDSSFYMGHDFYAIPFSVRDTVYSFGGYGFWRNNGILRVFNPYSHDWIPKRTDREVETTGAVAGAWVDPRENALYIANRWPLNEAVPDKNQGRSIVDSTAWKLDLSSATWTELGKLNVIVRPGFNSPWGLFYDKGALPLDFGIADFRNNRRWVLRKAATDRMARMYANQSTPEVFYFRDSTLYFGTLVPDRFDSISFSLSDFEDSGIALYRKPEESSMVGQGSGSSWWLIPLGLLLALGWMAWMVRRSIHSKQVTVEPMMHGSSTPMAEVQKPKDSGYAPPRPRATAFTNSELELIKLLHTRSLEERTVSLEEINHVLGLSAKNEAVQKKNRSDVITSINHKWSLLHDTDEKLIQRVRSEYDGRYFEYFLRRNWLQQVDLVIHGGS